jgi:YidC/Oxa1 family membrane protein insertase
MEKRVIIAFVLCFIVLYVFSALNTPPPSSGPPAIVESTENPPESTNPVVVPSQTPSEKETNEAPLQEIRAEKEEESVFDTPLYTATFSNVGGVLKSFKLKGYSDGTENSVEVINQEVGTKVGWPLALVSENKAVDEELRGAKFSVERAADRLVFEFAANGLHARKTVEFDSENYEFTVQTELSDAGKAKPHSVVWQGSFGDQSIPDDPAKKNAVHQVETAFERIALGSLKEEPQSFTTSRAGVEDPYFVAMFLATEAPVAVKVSNQKYSGADGKEIATLAVAAASMEGNPLRLYVGPKQQSWLSKADPQLASVLDYGYFGFIAEPLVSSLLWIHSYVGNFGWSIILLTVAINLIIFPLRLKQQVSMLKMQKIQPHMRRLQDQYKKLKANDPKREQVQREMMGLYKEHGVNPMGGCLPLLLQMPLLLGFYSALAYSIELRRAPWILWIKDLSQYDPYYVIPVLMAVAMVVQQKLTPTVNMDPAQARMMMLMPIIMTFMLLFVSSGLALYWLTGSVVGIAQQVFINKYWSPRAEAKLKTRPKPS